MNDPAQACEGLRADKACESLDQVQWCLAWEQWLCADCRLLRNDIELRGPRVIPDPAGTVPVLTL